jgi:hypothetical protein
MKPQDKSSGKVRFSAFVLRNLQTAYRTLDRAACREPWLVQGSVNVVDAKSPSASVTYTWTRKVHAKTVTIALSRQQSVAFRRAIEANQRIEAALSRLREASQTALLAEVPGVSKRRLGVDKARKQKASQRGLK